MKKKYIKISFWVIMTFLAFAACKKEDTQTFAPHLDRQGPIAATSEWLNTKAAIQGLQDVLRKEPNDLKSKLLLALAYMQEARVTGEHPHYYPAALNLLDDILDKDPSDPSLKYETIVSKATVLLSLHQFEEALEVGKQALVIDSTSASIYGVLCDAYVELGDYQKAIQMADKMTSIRPDLRSYSRISYLREIHGDLPGSIEAMQEAVTAGYPGLEQTAWARITLAHLYEATGDLQNAENQYKTALVERPHYAYAIAGLGNLETKKKNYDKAVALLKEAGKIMPEFSFQEELVKLYQLKGEIKKADGMMEDLLEGLEEDQEAGHVVHLELANIYAEIAGDYDKALKYARKEYKKRPNNIDVCKTLAYIHYKKKDYTEANTFIKIATRTHKKDASLLCLNGLIKYHSGDQRGGYRLINQALEINPFQEGKLAAEGKLIVKNRMSKL